MQITELRPFSHKACRACRACRTNEAESTVRSHCVWVLARPNSRTCRSLLHEDTFIMGDGGKPLVWIGEASDVTISMPPRLKHVAKRRWGINA